VPREMIFRKGLDLSVLTERRVLAPYGLAGGGPGMRGKNTLVSPIIVALKGTGSRDRIQFFLLKWILVVLGLTKNFLNF
jgi:hypothetical protein